MQKIILKEQLNGAPVSGTFSINTISSIQGLLCGVVVKPLTDTTSYNLSITDDRDMTIYERLSETGNMSEEMRFPVKGEYTVTIDNATRDELFKIQLIYEE